MNFRITPLYMFHFYRDITSKKPMKEYTCRKTKNILDSEKEPFFFFFFLFFFPTYIAQS